MSTTTVIKETDGLVYKGVKTESDNLNNVYQSGYWSCISGHLPTNKPDLAADVNAIFISYYSSDIGTGYQIWVEINQGVKNRYERRMVYMNGGWIYSAWKKVVYQETDHVDVLGNADLNNITDTGLYTVNGATNAPAEAPYGTLTVIQYSPGYITQTWNSVTTPDMFFRFRNPNTPDSHWSSWRKISSTEVTQITT